MISLQRNLVITKKPCDKGAGIIILKFESYMKSCLNEFSNQQLQKNGTLNPYYLQVEEKEVEETKKQIKCWLNTRIQQSFISCPKYIKLTFQKILHPGGLLSAAQEVTQRIYVYLWTIFWNPFPTYAYLIFRILQIF